MSEPQAKTYCEDHCQLDELSKEIKRLEGENKQLRNEKDSAVYEWVDLQEMLLAIKQHYEKRPKYIDVQGSNSGARMANYSVAWDKWWQKLGVLLNQEAKPWPGWLRKAVDSLPEELDQKTEDNRSCWYDHCDEVCTDVNADRCPLKKVEPKNQKVSCSECGKSSDVETIRQYKRTGSRKAKNFVWLCMSCGTKMVLEGKVEYGYLRERRMSGKVDT